MKFVSKEDIDPEIIARIQKGIDAQREQLLKDLDRPDKFIKNPFFIGVDIHADQRDNGKLQP